MSERAHLLSSVGRKHEGRRLKPRHASLRISGRINACRNTTLTLTVATAVKYVVQESYEERTSAVGEPVKFARRLSHNDGHVLGCPVYPEGMQRICDRSRHSRVILKGNADANRKMVSTGTSRSACTPSIWRVWTESRRTISKHIPPPTPSLPLLSLSSPELLTPGV